MQHKVLPHLWYDSQAQQAAEFYSTVFPDSRLKDVYTIENTPSGNVEVVSFEVWGHPFIAISAGPHFTFTPAISFIVGCDSREQVDAIWEKLIRGGEALMPLDEYPFSPRYGWVKDKFGLSWQLILTSPQGDERPRIVPSMLFVGEQYGSAEEAIDFYTSIFTPAEKGGVHHYGPGMEPNTEGTVMFGEMKLIDEWIAVMDGGGEHDFTFNEAVSFMVNCENQEEIDYYWEKLSHVPDAEQCGWLKDRFGVSWQIVPRRLEEMMKDPDEDRASRVIQAALKMKKIDLAELQQAYVTK